MSELVKSGSSTMENRSAAQRNNEEASHQDLQIVKYSPYKSWMKISPSWFDLRVLYIRLSKFRVDESTPESFTVKYVPLTPNTFLEGNSLKNSKCSEETSVSSLLRRDRVDEKFEETTFISTDTVKFTGSMKFEVFDGEDLLLSGVLDMAESKDFVGKSEERAGKWQMNCQTGDKAGAAFLKERHGIGGESVRPEIEVYIAGFSSGKPIIFTKTLRVGYRSTHDRKNEFDTVKRQKYSDHKYGFQVEEQKNYSRETEEGYINTYWGRTDYLESENGELTLFNAGVRVGVGIGLGVCLGVGVGIGLLVRTYQVTTRKFRWSLF